MSKNGKKVKRMLAMCLASAMILSAMVLPASAESLGVSLRSSYNKTPVSTCNVKYDIGSIMPYDDVRAATRVKLESSSGYAKVSLVGGKNGGRASKSDYNADSSGWLDSLWATVESTDYATSVTHSGSTGITSHNYTAG